MTTWRKFFLWKMIFTTRGSNSPNSWNSQIFQKYPSGGRTCPARTLGHDGIPAVAVLGVVSRRRHHLGLFLGIPCSTLRSQVRFIFYNMLKVSYVYAWFSCFGDNAQCVRLYLIIYKQEKTKEINPSSESNIYPPLSLPIPIPSLNRPIRSVFLVTAALPLLTAFSSVLIDEKRALPTPLDLTKSEDPTRRDVESASPGVARPLLMGADREGSSGDIASASYSGGEYEKDFLINLTSIFLWHII